MGRIFTTTLFLCLSLVLQAGWNPQYNGYFEGEFAPLFSGGLDWGRPLLFDLDGDGDLDLVLGSDIGRFILWENTGTPTAYQFEMIDEKWGGIENTDIRLAPALGDLDGDGDLELILGNTEGKLLYYENAGGTPLQPEYSLIDSLFLGVDYSFKTIPCLIDIDDDGDLDLFISSNDGFVVFYRNITDYSMPVAMPEFELVDSTLISFGSISPGFSMNDIDLDGLNDIVLVINSSLFLVPNMGTALEPSFFAFDSSYFTNSPFPAVGLATGDLDGDGIAEIVIGGEHLGTALLHNSGSVSSPSWETTTQWQTIDASYRVTVNTVDINGDGLLDLFISGYNKTIALENIGTLGDPRWTVNLDFTTGLDYSRQWRPTFGDIDGDGDYDMLCGSWDNQLHYFENIGTATNPIWASRVEGWMGITHVDSYLGPSFVDIDDDGDLDLYIGDQGRQMHYYENTGSSTSPIFADSIFLGDFPGSSTSALYRPILCFVDYDDDGDYDIIGGSDYTNSKLFYIENTGTATDHEWLEIHTDFIDTSYGKLNSAAVMDYDNDGYLDLICGNYQGGINLYIYEPPHNIDDVSVSTPNLFEIYAYPNPFNSSVTIAIDGVGDGSPVPFDVEIYDVAGRRVTDAEPVVAGAGRLAKDTSTLRQAQGTAGSVSVFAPLTKGGQGGSYVWQPDASLGSGVYLVRATVGEKTTTKRIVYLK